MTWMGNWGYLKDHGPVKNSAMSALFLGCFTVIAGLYHLATTKAPLVGLASLLLLPMGAILLPLSMFLVKRINFARHVAFVIAGVIVVLGTVIVVEIAVGSGNLETVHAGSQLLRVSTYAAIGFVVVPPLLGAGLIVQLIWAKDSFQEEVNEQRNATIEARRRYP